MLNKFNINIDELKSNIDGIKSMVNKKKTYQTVGKRTLNKHIELDDDNTIEICIDANVTADENGNEIVLNSKNVDQILLNIAQIIVKNTTENMLMPKNIIISSDEHAIDKLEYANIKREYEDIDLDIVNIEKPRCTMAEVVLNEELRKGVSRILAINKNKNKIVNEMKIQNSLKLGDSVLCNFYGESGSGKSSVIHSIANELNKNIVTLNYNLLEAIPNHNIPKMVKFVFEIAKKTKCSSCNRRM